MSLKKCKECGSEVSTKAMSCPKCGAVQKKKSGCLQFFRAALLVFFVIVIITAILSKPSKKPSTSATSASPTSTSTSPGSDRAPKQTQYKERDSVSIGYTSYAVWRSWWSSRLSDNEYLNQRPDAKFLFVELAVRNNDKKPRAIPPFRLLDENGAEYEASSKAWVVDGSIGILESLNPSVTKQGFVVFDVPTGHNYRLKVSGGYWSGEDALIQLAPGATKPR